MAAAAAGRSLLRPHYSAVVIGAGPAGLAALANLLDADVQSLLWVDPDFTSGRLSMYQQVPSNTKVQLFLDFAMASPTLANVVRSMSYSPVQQLQSMDPQGTCSLKHAIRMVTELTEGVKKHYADKVNCFQGRAIDVVRQPSKAAWSVSLQEEKRPASTGVVDTSTVIFATGSRPVSPHPSHAPHLLLSSSKIEELSLETALDPNRLSSAVSSRDVVAIVGSSHSAILCLKNTAELENRPRKIVHYYRSKPRYAVAMDGWILYDNTGLKGEAAEWCRNVLEKGLVPSLEAHFLEDEATEGEVYRRTMPEVTKIIYAIGFQRIPLPKLLPEGAGAPELKPEVVSYLAKTGKMKAGDVPMPGLWGYGIAFPEETVDPYGNREFAVGLWKFMRYLKRTIHQDVVPELLNNETPA